MYLVTWDLVYFAELATALGALLRAGHGCPPLFGGVWELGWILWWEAMPESLQAPIRGHSATSPGAAAVGLLPPLGGRGTMKKPAPTCVPETCHSMGYSQQVGWVGVHQVADGFPNAGICPYAVPSLLCL